METVVISENEVFSMSDLLMVHVSGRQMNPIREGHERQKSIVEMMHVGGSCKIACSSHHVRGAVLELGQKAC